MGVHFIIKPSDNKGWADIRDFCFRELGRSNGPDWAEWSDREDERKYRNKLTHAGVVHWIPRDTTEADDVLDTYTEEELLLFMKEVIAAVPFARTVLQARMNPDTKKAYVTAVAGTNPCDKTITALFLVRNLVYLEHSNKIYKELRGRGIGTLASVIIASVLIESVGLVGTRYYFRSTGEYNLFNLETFGKQGLINFITHGEDWNPWRQGDWATQRHYKRDHQLGLEDRLRGFHGEVADRSILDCFSIDADEPFFVDADGWMEDAVTLAEVIGKVKAVFAEVGKNFYE